MNAYSMVRGFILTLVCSSFLMVSNAQSEIVWKGGTPGMEHEWNCANNWIPERVPNEFSNVIIPNVSTASQSYPIIKEGEEVAVNALFVNSQAVLTLSETSYLLVFEQLIDPRKNVKGEGLLLRASNKEGIAQE